MTSRTSNWRDPVPHTELSERQQEILEFLWNYPSPYSPSFREIGNAVGLTGPSAVRYQIRELERKGWVLRHPGRPRALDDLFQGMAAETGRGWPRSVCDDRPGHPRYRTVRENR